MRTFIFLFGLAILGFTGCKDAPQQATKGGPSSRSVAQVLARKTAAGRSCARVLLDDERIASVHLHGFQYLAALKRIDTTRCPEPFRAAWADYLKAWENKLDREHATEETLDLISMWKGGLDDLSASLTRIEAYDTEPAWQNCERVALEYGINSASETATRREVNSRL